MSLPSQKPKLPTAEERVFCALDAADLATAENLARQLGRRIAGLKLGSEFFCAHGPDGVERLARHGRGIFLDLKFHDIPTTVLRAIQQVASLPIRMLTLHASGGTQMMRSAVEAARSSPSRPLILAVTVLTSLHDDDLSPMGISGSCADHVEKLCSLALASGVDGIVCSPLEISKLRERFGTDFLIVTPGIRPSQATPGIRPSQATPGIRPSQATSDDQRRTATFHEAIHAGADYVVIGRPITAADDPVQALNRIVAENSDSE